MSKVIPKRLCELFSEFHKRFPSGGFLHIATDDGNWETNHIVWCLMHWKDYCNDEELKWLEEHEREIIKMCSLILELTEKQRYKIWGEVEKFNELLNERKLWRKIRMISVSELKEVCERIEREYGSDSKVVIQIRNEDGSLKYGDYALDVFCSKDGTLFFTNKPFKYGNCE